MDPRRRHRDAVELEVGPDLGEREGRPASRLVATWRKLLASQATDTPPGSWTVAATFADVSWAEAASTSVCARGSYRRCAEPQAGGVEPGDVGPVTRGGELGKPGGARCRR